MTTEFYMLSPVREGDEMLYDIIDKVTGSRLTTYRHRPSAEQTVKLLNRGDLQPSELRGHQIIVNSYAAARCGSNSPVNIKAFCTCGRWHAERLKVRPGARDNAEGELREEYRRSLPHGDHSGQRPDIELTSGLFEEKSAHEVALEHLGIDQAELDDRAKGLALDALRKYAVKVEAERDRYKLLAEMSEKRAEIAEGELKKLFPIIDGLKNLADDLRT